MKFGIVTFPGSNCDDDAYNAVTEALGETGVRLWHKDHDLQGVDVVILPGGFSYGDYLRAGAIARFSPIMREVVEHALSSLGFSAVSGVRVGKAIELAVAAGSPDEARAAATAMCDRLLANPVTEDYVIEVEA